MSMKVIISQYLHTYICTSTNLTYILQTWICTACTGRFEKTWTLNAQVFLILYSYAVRYSISKATLLILNLGNILNSFLEMFDQQNKGTINIHEFGALFNYINQWKATFESIDKDRSGFIESAELNQGEWIFILF